YPDLVSASVRVPDPTNMAAAGQLDVELARTKARVMGEVHIRQASRKIERDPSAPAFMKILELSAQRGVPIVIHDELTPAAAGSVSCPPTSPSGWRGRTRRSSTTSTDVAANPFARATAWSLLETIAARHGPREAIVFDDARLTFAAVRDRARVFAAGLAALGLGRGGTLAPAAVAPDDTFTILYTSGTTSFPKGAMITHANCVPHGWNCGETLRLTPADRILHALPAAGTWGGVNIPLTAWSHGACLVLMDVFDPLRALMLIERERCTVWNAVDSMLI